MHRDLEIAGVDAGGVTVPVSQGGMMAYGPATSRTCSIRNAALEPRYGLIVSAETMVPAGIRYGYAVVSISGFGSNVCSPAIARPSRQESSLAKAIDAAFLRTTFDDAGIRDLTISARDAAVEFVRANLPHAKPMVMVSDEGAVMLQWRHANTGAIIVFHGDGTASYSIKGPGGSYSLGVNDLPLAGAFPIDLRETIDHLEAIKR